MDKKLKDKLKKLFALANDAGATEAESNTAMLKAQELLALHKLSMSDLDLKEEGATTESSIEIGRRPWMASLYSAASRLCFCQMFLNKNKIVIIGKPSDIESAKCLGEYLVSTCLKLASQFENNKKGDRSAWKAGFSTRVSGRSIEIVKQARENKLKNSETGKELILSSLYSQSDLDCYRYLRDKGIRVEQVNRSTKIKNANAYQSGREAGNSVHLGTNVIGGGRDVSTKLLSA